ncbi:high mobility group protein dsp1 [Anaeramoeba flamelloides]|uniref:High mobility group protein dsp1 n=1 Tax=Anaeramoeba flamelloides TaxID=1746091 RepID=A0ABQ8YC03_9EUKA|nr:high mobility group protein dsp1 [Anaeramoeba flamelloides]
MSRHKKRSRGSKSKADPNRPKSRLTSYLFFNKEINNQIRNKYPDMKFSEISREISKRWKRLTDKERQKYVDLSEQDGLRYEREMKEYLKNNPNAPIKKPRRNSTGSSKRHNRSRSGKKSGRSRSGNKKKDPKKPKARKTAYNIFNADRWLSVKNKFPNKTFGEISKEVGKLWKSLTEKEKEKYNRKSEEDKIRFEKEMKVYKKENRDKFNSDDEWKEKSKSRKKSRRHSNKHQRDSRRHRRRHRRGKGRRRRSRSSDTSSSYSSTYSSDFTSSSYTSSRSSFSGSQSWSSSGSSSQSYSSD